MKPEINNLIIIGAASPLLIYGVCKYYKSSFNITKNNLNLYNNNESYSYKNIKKDNHENAVNNISEIDSFNLHVLDKLNIETHSQQYDLSLNETYDDYNSNNNIISPTLSKKNSIISSRTSSIVDLSELESLSSNNTHQNIKHFDEDAHFVECDINEVNKKYTPYLSLSFVKKWFGS